MAADCYALLGVDRSATDDEIKRAYRRLARELHPDANPDNPDAEARFKEITQAYEILRDPQRRRQYDMFGHDAARVGGGAGGGEAFGFGDLFDAFFTGSFGGGGRGGPSRAPDAEAVIDLDLHEAAFGTTYALEVHLPVPCDRCEGSGCEPGTFPQRCGTCSGSGEVRQVRRSMLGQLVTAAPCPTCSATGSVIPSPCSQCRGDGRVRATRTLDVEVPAGIDDGQRLRLAGRGPAAPRGGVPGDLYVSVRIRPHPELTRDGVDLLVARRLAMTQAVLGSTIEVETLEGPEEIEIPPGTQPGHVFRLSGRGVPVLQGRGRGDLLVGIEVEMPSRLTAEEAELLERFAELRGEEVSSGPGGGLFSRLRSAFQAGQ